MENHLFIILVQLLLEKKIKVCSHIWAVKATRFFYKKWKIGINFFEKFYLRSGLDKNKNKIFNKYDGPLTEPIKNIEYYFELLKTKLQLFYLRIINYK